LSESSTPGAVADEPLTDERPDRGQVDEQPTDRFPGLEEPSVEELPDGRAPDDGAADDGAPDDVLDGGDPDGKPGGGVRRDAAGGLVIVLSPRVAALLGSPRVGALLRLARTTGPLALVAATLVACTTSSAPPAPPTARVERASVTTAVSSAGSLSAITEQNVGFNKAGQLKTVNVKVGQRVATGDVLATLDDTSFRHTLEQQQGQLNSQQAALNQLINATTVSGAQKTTNQAKDILAATKDQGGATVDASRSAVDQAQKTLNFDENARDDAQKQLDAANKACAASRRASSSSSSSSAANSAALAAALGSLSSSSSSGSSGSSSSSSGSSGSSGSSSSSSGSSGSSKSVQQQQKERQKQLEAAIKAAGGILSASSAGSSASDPCSQAAAAQSAFTQADRQVRTDKAALDQAKNQRDVDEASGRLSNENAQQSLISAQNNLDSARTDRPSLIAQQQGLVAAQAALVREAQKDVDDTVLRAPASATVSAVNGVVGEYLQPGSVTTPLAPGTDGAIPGAGAGTAAAAATNASTVTVSRPGGTQFIVLNNMDQFDVVVPFEESDALQISPDQKVNVTFDAIPDLTLPGTVVAVSPSSTSLASVISYYATVALTQGDPRLRNGQTAQTAVLTSELNDVLSVPNSAVHQEGGRSTVTVLGFDGPRTVEFQPGAVGDERTQVLSGLTAGDEVVVPSGR